MYLLWQGQIEMEQNSAPGRQEASLVGSGGIQNGGGYDDQGFTFAAGAVAAVAGAGGVAIGGAGGVSVGGGISVTGDAGAVGGGGGAGVAGPSSQSSIGKKRGNHRHSDQQINAMGAYYKDNQHPNKSQRNQLASSLGMNPDQVQFWFQNQCTQEKRKSKREENEAIRSELDVLRAQNPQYEEAIQLLAERNRLKLESIHTSEATELCKSTLARFIAGENLQNLPIFQDPQNPTTSQNPQNLSSTFHKTSP
ncbi:hypothetical protein POM88_008091 [Heracleum sosnowskyi]|uniref:Homeobox domain-containing protein n=1 Tax=Heracleum sosnowskyi TaxID=360622 RepID=A0AAD8J6M9_9APIA|nr:hypothetical protein POM88_008091 [Heracleum sosnowskyi]